MHAATYTQILTTQYRYTAYVFAANLEGLSDDAAFLQPAPGGNCLNWVAGHILQARASTLTMLGQDLPFAADKYDRYQRGGAPLKDAADTVPLSAMIADFAATEAGLQAGLAGLTAEKLAAKAPFSPGRSDTETVGSLLAGLVFHEGYHIGQLGLLRRLAGVDGAIK